MKPLVLTCLVIFLSSTALADEEYVEEEVCPAVAGCWMNPETGECPDCITERRESTHTHEGYIIYGGVVNKKPKHKTPVYSPPALIRFEECAHAGATPWSEKRTTIGCEIYLWSPQKRKEQGLTW